MREPNTMMPDTAATQNVGRLANVRSNSGKRARVCRQKKATPPRTVITPMPITVIRWPSSATKLMVKTSPPKKMAEKMPPQWSTGSVVSLSLAGTLRITRTMATTAKGTATRNIQFHVVTIRSAPAISGESAERPAPRADHSAMAVVRRDPAQMAVIRARVVG